MYYILSYSKDITKVGRFPQSNSMTDGYQYNAPNSVKKMLSKKIDFEPNLRGAKLYHRAKWTDLIFSSHIGSEVRGNLLVSEKLYHLISEFNLPPFQKFDAEIVKRKKKLNYFLMHFYTSQNHFIDFEKSEFYVGPRSRFKFYDIQLNSVEEYDLKIKELRDKFGTLVHRRMIGVSKLVLKDSIDEFDFFRISNLANHFIISEKLLNALLNHNITGFDYLPLNELTVKVYQVDSL